MATKKKMLQAAAGNAGGGGGAAGLNVEDVFSTYLYEGTSAPQAIENGIALGDFGRGTSTLFGDGAFLNRTSDLTGNSDGKTLTLSVWVFPEEDTNLNFFACANSGGSNRMLFSLDDTQKLVFALYNSSGTGILNLESRATSGAGLPLKAWSHVLISVDLSDTSKRHLYINDAIPSHVDWDAYTNDNVDFTQPKWGVGGGPTSGTGTERMAHLYFDYTYRDLSVASNRRHFIDANGGSTSSSTQSALNPIIYLPLTEDYTTGKNLGTGGDFTINGSPTVLDTGTEYEDGYGEGGLVWIKSRTESTYGGHALFDTERGPNKVLTSSGDSGVPATMAEVTSSSTSQDLTSFNSNGFSLGPDYYFTKNTSGEDYASWTFRKAPKFFTCLTYTGTGPGSAANEQQVSHDLGAKPGIVIIKRTDATGNWWVFTDVIDGSNDYGYLNQTAAFGNSANNVATDSVFNVGGVLNTSGATYAAYLFASNDGDGEFGPDGDLDIIKCGSYTGVGSGAVDVDLGFEPQFIITRNVSRATEWNLQDTMRGMSHTTWSRVIPNLNDAELSISADFVVPTATGFTINNNGGNEFGQSGDTVIYIAIRRGTKVPESATEVFDVDAYSGNSTAGRIIPSAFPVDLAIVQSRSAAGDTNAVADRLRGANVLLNTPTADAELTNNTDSITGFDFMDGIEIGTDTRTNWSSGTYVSWMWKRAPGYFDAVAYSGNSTAGRTVSHNLGVAPEMIWVKARGGSENWPVYHASLGNSQELRLDTSNTPVGGSWNSTDPTSSEFTLASYGGVNNSSLNYIAYLFASLDGISKVGSFSHTTGSTTDVDCGFSSGARFVLFKRTSATGVWFVFDTERGIVSGNDPYLRLDDTSAEINLYDLIDPLSSGFTVGTPVGTGDYIFYAIA